MFGGRGSVLGDPVFVAGVSPGSEFRELGHERIFLLVQISTAATEAPIKTNVMEGMAQFVERQLENLFHSHPPKND
jgi:hypothetical protein